MSDDFKIQASFKTRSNPNSQLASLLNVRANDADELGVNLDALIAALPKINEIEALLGAVEVVQEAFAPQSGASTPPQGQQAAYGAPAAPQGQYQQRSSGGPGSVSYKGDPGQANPQGQPAEICAHGPRYWKEGINKGGKPYKGWFCTPNADGCAPGFKR